jgi:hypothetical protein
MDEMALLDTLRRLEIELHQPEVRSDRRRLDGLLHRRFRELGRSGRAYSRGEIVAEFADGPQTHKIWSQEFQVEPLTEGLVLLTYKSAHINADGKLERHTIRSSLWQSTEHGWQIRFHQGTPTQAFPRDAT